MILFLAFVMLDFFVSLRVGISIGYLASVAWIVLSALLGGVLLRLSPYALINNFQTFNFGKFSLRDMHNAGMAYLGGSILLIIPGVLSDLLGVSLFAYLLYLHLFATIRPEKANGGHDACGSQNIKGEYDVIDVEIVDEPGRGDNNRGSG